MKRVFALVVCLCMVFAMVPAASAATGDVSLNGNAIYNTVEEALAAAVAGDTVTLNADVTAGQVIVPKNVTLDLGGYNLTADLVIAMNGEISGEGNVVVAEDMLKIIGNNGGKLAVWDSENGTYVFAEPTYNQLMNVAEDLSYANYIFVPYLDEATTAMLADGGADNGISVKVLLTWNEGASQQIYTFSDDLVSQVYGGNYALVFQLTITGFAGIEDMTACAVVESAAGGKAANVESAVALPQEPEVETSGSIEIESYGNAEWTAPQDGYVQFTINIPGATLAIVEGYAPIAEGTDSVTAQVTAGTTYLVAPGFDVTENSVVTWEYVDAPAGGDEEDDSVPSGSALALGDNNVTLTYANMPAMAPYWTYTATENGNLTVTVSSINGDSNLGMAFGMGRYTLMVGEATGEYTNTATVYMNAGETVNIAVLNTLGDAPAVINLSFAAGSDEPVVEKNPADYFDRDENGYYVIGSLESPVDIFVGNDDINYIYVAEKAGTVTVTATVADAMTATNCWFIVNDDNTYSSDPVAVVEGDVVIINIWQGYEGTVSLETGAVEPEPSEPEVTEPEPSNPVVEKNPADYFDRDENGNYVIGSLESPVDIFVGNDDINYIYVAEKAGTVTVNATVADVMTATNCWIITNGVTDTSAAPVAVVEGDVVIINIWSGYEGTVSFEASAVETEPVETEPVETEPEDPYAEQAAIMEQIKALAVGESINDVTLTGEITKINTVYSEQYGNVTVTIKVFGTEDTLKCYRIKGDAASIVAVGDTITVNGVVKNYQHSSGDTELEFDAGSMIIEHIPAGGATEPDVPETEPTDPAEPPAAGGDYSDQAEIMEQIKALAAGESINDVTLTGEITKINTVYSEQYGNVTVTIKVFGTEDTLKCYRIKGDAASIVAVGDTITVNGVVKNYQHSSGDTELEFDAGSMIIEHIPATPVETEPVETEPEATEPEATEPEVEPVTSELVLTVDSLGLTSQSYTSTTGSVDGVDFEWVQLGNYGNGIQVRDKNGNTSTLWNTSAFGKTIKEIKLVYSSTMNVQYANADCEIFSFGNEAGNYTYSTKLSTTAGVKEYTITPDADTYTFFKFEHDLGYTMYWDSITIVFAD